MGYSSANIHFDYDEHYAKSGDDYEWIPITYSFLKERICNKKTIYPCTKRLNLSYIPLVVEPKRQSYILDDEDLFVYLTSGIEEMEIVPVMEQQSRVEKESSYGGNYTELASGLPKLEDNMGALTLFTHVEEAERHLAVAEWVENVVNGEAEEGVLVWITWTGWTIRATLLLQEFPSKDDVKDIIDRASQENCFGISIANSDKSRYVEATDIHNSIFLST
ncbi:hypothetical protein N665_0551s0002 [Sinapis alba]|nr:hypothetical protein N665_0551s0002 [Sinapis alba]